MGCKGQIGGQKKSFSQVMSKVIVWKYKYGDQWEIPHHIWCESENKRVNMMKRHWLTKIVQVLLALKVTNYLFQMKKKNCKY